MDSAGLRPLRPSFNLMVLRAVQPDCTKACLLSNGQVPEPIHGTPQGIVRHRVSAIKLVENDLVAGRFKGISSLLRI